MVTGVVADRKAAYKKGPRKGPFSVSSPPLRPFSFLITFYFQRRGEKARRTTSDTTRERKKDEEQVSVEMQSAKHQSNEIKDSKYTKRSCKIK